MSAMDLLQSSGAALRRSGSWYELTRLVPERGDVRSGPIGWPGLWRGVRKNGGLEWVFELPALGGRGDAADGSSPRDVPGDALLEWAHATALGEWPADWQAPDPDEVASWSDLGRLDLRSGRHLVKGELECSATRLRLHFPELVQLDHELPQARASWMRELCLDTQTRWRLVRLGVDGGFVRAEVDLTGVPACHARRLFELSLEALVCSLGRVLPPLALITDPSAGCRALDREPWWSGSTRWSAELKTPDLRTEE